MPLAAYATLDGATLRLRAAWGDPDRPGVLVQAELTRDVTSLQQAADLGTEVASRLRDGGAH